MTIDFWDVGQGDCTVITRSDGKLTLIDVGPRTSPLVSWLENRRGLEISDIVLTHNDADHIGLIPALIDRFGPQVGTVWILQDGNRSGARQKSVRNLLSPLVKYENAGGVVKTIRSDLTIWNDMATGTNLEIRYPSALSAVLNQGQPNDGSAILALRHPRVGSILWPGDNTLARTDEVKPGGDVEKMVGPHHGQPDDCRKPDRNKFHAPTESISPNSVFISVATKNGHSHPNPRYLSFLQRQNCVVACSGLTRWCDRRINQREAGRHVVNGAARLGLRRTASGFACRGALRITVDQHGYVEDGNASDHRKAVQELTHPMCIPRDKWRRNLR